MSTIYCEIDKGDDLVATPLGYAHVWYGKSTDKGCRDMPIAGAALQQADGKAHIVRWGHLCPSCGYRPRRANV